VTSFGRRRSVKQNQRQHNETATTSHIRMP
jgi:hypothetical protein